MQVAARNTVVDGRIQEQRSVLRGGSYSGKLKPSAGPTESPGQYEDY
jgi:hypothetical protein